jgi:hypothetical protein
MSQNINQGLSFATVTFGQVGTIQNARAFNVVAVTSAVTISQYVEIGGVQTLQSEITLPADQTFEASADGSNLFSDIRITPASGGTALVSTVAGIVTVATP